MDEELERLIDDAGRTAVFERARLLGWSQECPPPAWVWREIAADVKDGKPSGLPPKRMDEALLGFRLL